MQISSDDTVYISRSITRIARALEDGIKSKEEIQLSCGKATVYHLGNRSRTVRVDIKLKQGEN